MGNQVQKHTATVIILFSLMIGWVIIEYTPSLKSNLMSGQISFEANNAKLFEMLSNSDNHYVSPQRNVRHSNAPGQTTPPNIYNRSSNGGSSSIAPQYQPSIEGQGSSGRSYTGVPEGSSGSFQRQTHQQTTTRQDGSTTLGQDSRDFARSSYNAARLGYEIMNDDPFETAGKLMYDEEYQQRVLQTGTELIESSERMYKHADEAAQQTEQVQQRAAEVARQTQQQTQQRMNDAARQAEQTQQRASEAVRQTQERTQQRVNDLRDKLSNRKRR
jgi:hypothetical protein